MTQRTSTFENLFDDKVVTDQLWCVGECFMGPLRGVGYDIRPVEVESILAEGFMGLRQTVRMPWQDRVKLLPKAPAQLIFEQQCQVRWSDAADGTVTATVELFAMMQEPHLHDSESWLYRASPAGHLEPVAPVWSARLAEDQATLESKAEMNDWLRALMAQWESSAVPSHLVVLAALRAADNRLGPSDAPFIDAEEFTSEGLQALMQAPALKALIGQMQQSMAAAWEHESLPWTDIVADAPVIQQSPAITQALWQWRGSLGPAKLVGAGRFTLCLQWSVEQQQLHCALRFERPTNFGQKWHNGTIAWAQPLNVSHATLRDMARFTQWLGVMAADSATWCERLLHRQSLLAILQLNKEAARGTAAEFAMWAGSFGNQPWLYRLMRQADAVLREELSVGGFAPKVSAGDAFPYTSIAQVTSTKMAAWAVRQSVTPIAGHREVDVQLRIVVKPKDGVATLRVELFAGFGAGHGITKKLVEGTIDWVEGSPLVAADSWQRRTDAINEALFNAFLLEPAEELVPVIREYAQNLAEELVP